jgi:hypothetical protein
VDAVLLSLARAVRQLHTYPPTNPRCLEAVITCEKTLVAIDGTDVLEVAVTPQGLRFGDEIVGEAAMVDQELGHRLRRGRIAFLSISRTASRRDLTRLCLGLIRCAEHPERDTRLSELLAEDGVETIEAKVIERPEVLDVGTASFRTNDLLEHERRRQQELRDPQAPMEHLYAPNKGWVRVDPACDHESMSLSDLAILVDNPVDLAGMLDRLTDDATDGDGSGRALDRRFGDVAKLFASLDPRLGRVMFARLARIVLEMDAERRRQLLRRTVLPGLLDGRVDGAILQDFPDPDLAESLCLLLDLETAAPEVVATALDCVGLAPERRAAVAPLLDAQLQARERSARAGGRGADADLDRHARRLTRIDPAAGKSFAEFAAFDLALDAAARATLDRLRQQVSEGDGLVVELHCLTNLVRLQPNPQVVEGFLAEVVPRVAQLMSAGRWSEFADVLRRLADAVDNLRERRPDVAAAIATTLSSLATRELAVKLVVLREAGGAEDPVETAIEALGAALAPALISLIADPDSSTTDAWVARALGDRASVYAPVVAEVLDRHTADTRAHLVRILGAAGSGYESIVGEQFAMSHEKLTRESLRALARMGTSHAAALVAAQVRDRHAWVASAALEALWRFPAGRPMTTSGNSSGTGRSSSAIRSWPRDC